MPQSQITPDTPIGDLAKYCQIPVTQVPRLNEMVQCMIPEIWEEFRNCTVTYGDYISFTEALQMAARLIRAGYQKQPISIVP